MGEIGLGGFEEGIEEDAVKTVAAGEALVASTLECEAEWGGVFHLEEKCRREETVGARDGHDDQ